ncbi:inositol monophosphatase family protein [Gottfriedia solisilvae]|nr:inositol monophosphatase family protein [Gottfriedia solisilvae]
MDIDKLDEWSNFAEKMVRAAGKKVVELKRESLVEMTYKKVGELVTSADFASDQIIRDAIEKCYPEHRILSEENITKEINKETFKGPLWIVDPLDGTVNYSKNLPHFAISLAIAIDGVVWVGVVHSPELNITFIGIRGRGAFCNGEKISVNGIKALSDAVIGTGFPHDKSQIKEALTRVNKLATHCRDIRRFAAPTLDICYVASGLLDAHTESLAPWDVAAAGLIAREAGAKIGHVGIVSESTPFELNGEEIVYATPGIFEDLLILLRKK